MSLVDSNKITSSKVFIDVKSNHPKLDGKFLMLATNSYWDGPIAGVGYDITKDKICYFETFEGEVIQLKPDAIDEDDYEEYTWYRRYVIYSFEPNKEILLHAQYHINALLRPTRYSCQFPKLPDLIMESHPMRFPVLEKSANKIIHNMINSIMNYFEKKLGSFSFEENEIVGWIEMNQLIYSLSEVK